LVTGSALTRRADGTFLDGPMHRRLLELLTKHRLEPLLRDGAHVVEYVTPPSPLVVLAGGTLRPYVHAKLVIVDGLVASVGSANLDDTASFWEREANVVIEDPHVVGPLELEVQALAARGLPLDATSESWLS